MSAKKRLFVDMDGTLAKFRRVDELEMLYQAGYFTELEPQQNVVDAVNILNDDPDIEVFILSAYLGDSEFAEAEKQFWLDINLPNIDRSHRCFIECGKNKIEAVPGGLRDDDFLLDDYNENLSVWDPPAHGIKLLNGINHTRGTWDKDCLSFEKSPQELVNSIKSIMLNNEHIIDEKPADRSSRLDEFENDLDKLADRLARYQEDVDPYGCIDAFDMALAEAEKNYSNLMLAQVRLCARGMLLGQGEIDEFLDDLHETASDVDYIWADKCEIEYSVQARNLLSSLYAFSCEYGDLLPDDIREKLNAINEEPVIEHAQTSSAVEKIALSKNSIEKEAMPSQER